MSYPVFTIIVPVYNTEKYLWDCLLSIQKQVLDNFEVIVVDDGSTDNSFNIASRFCKTDSRFKLFRQNHQGVSRARNYALSKARGRYIAFLDSDDWIATNFLDQVLRIFFQTKVDIVCTNFYVWHQSYKETKSPVSDSSFLGLTPATFLKAVLSLNLDREQIAQGGYIWNKVFRNEVIKGYRFSESIEAGEDEYFCVSILNRGLKIAYSPVPLIFYRQHVSSTVRKKSFPFKHMYVRELMLKECQQLEFKDMLYAAYIQSLFSCISRIVCRRELCTVQNIKTIKNKAILVKRKNYGEYLGVKKLIRRYLFKITAIRIFASVPQSKIKLFAFIIKLIPASFVLYLKNRF